MLCIIHHALLDTFHHACHLQGRGKLHKAILLHMLAGSLADVATAAFVASHAALGTLTAQPDVAAAAVPVSGKLPAPQQAGQVQQHTEPPQQQHRPALALAVGCTLVVHMPHAYLASHGNDATRAAACVAASLQQALLALQVGGTRLAVPLPAAFAVGRSLHPLALRPVLASAADAQPLAL